MKRYLLYLSYIGSNFRGIQVQCKPKVSNIAHVEITTVQGVLENALRTKFRFTNDIRVITSSRTDAGVHCLQTGVHVDLQSPLEDREVHPDIITHTLNRHFVKKSIDIRIQKTQVVPETFHARYSAISRSYLYRFAVRKTQPHSDAVRSPAYINDIPMSEHQRTYFIPHPDFDVEIAQRAAQQFPGTKDFKTFMGRPVSYQKKLTCITLHSAKLQPSSPLLPGYDPSSDNYNYWEFVVEGKSFLYRQVRRMVSSLIALGQGILTYQEFQQMLDEPSEHSWSPRVIMVPAYGLYLLKVTYNPEDLIMKLVEEEEVRAGVPVSC